MDILSWKDTLKKFRPSYEYGEDQRPKDKASEGYAETKQFDRTGIIFMPHFNNSKKTRYPNLSHEPITPEIEQTLLNLPVGSYWCYINKDPRDKSYLMFDVLNESQKLPRTKLAVSNLLDESGENYTKAVAIIHVNDGHSYQTRTHGGKPVKKVDIFYTGIKPNHNKKVSENKRNPRPNQPKNPFDMTRRR